MNTLDWIFPIVASALFLGTYDISKKAAVKDNSVMPVLFWATVAGGIFFSIIMLCTGKFGVCIQAGKSLFLPVFLKSMIVSASWIFGYYAMRELPISIASPIRASSPIWTFIGGLLLYGERPTLLQGLAMLIIFCGYYAFSVLGKLEGISFRRSRGIWLILLATLTGSVSALYDKYLLHELQLPRDEMQFWFSMDLILILGSVYLIRKTLFSHAHSFQWRWTIPATGLLLIAADYLYFYGLSQPGAPISMISLVRRSSCVVTFAAGSLWFHEQNKLRKALALVLILSGVILLALVK